MKVALNIHRGLEGFAKTVAAPLPRFPSHHHDELEINLILSGKATYLLNAQRVPLIAGSMIWLFPKQEHLLINCSHDFAMWVLVFKPKLIARYTDLPTRRVLRSADPGKMFCRQIASRNADALGSVYQRAARGEEDLEFGNTALAYALLLSWEVFEFSDEPIVLTDVHPSVGRAALLISQADEIIPLPQLARQAGLSAARLSRLFKQQTGVSLTIFRQRKCLERFFRLYRTGHRYSLIEAALMAGFGSYPQFHRVFHRIMGCSPAAYRRRLSVPTI